MAWQQDIVTSLYLTRMLQYRVLLADRLCLLTAHFSSPPRDLVAIVPPPTVNSPPRHCTAGSCALYDGSFVQLIFCYHLLDA
eukprot:4049751-Pleurochrysis_carterae.AAC.2